MVRVTLPGGQGHVRESGHVYRGDKFNGGRMVMLQKWSVSWRENGHVTASLMERE